MSEYYKVDIYPIEPYTFGTEQGSRFELDGATKTGKETYIIDSDILPQQTMVLGALRYIVLSNTRKLKTDFNYTSEEEKEIWNLIGEKSFSFNSQEEQDFGVIEGISPIFLTEQVVDENQQTTEFLWIRNPFHNRGTAGYCPMKMGSNIINTSFGDMNLALASEYDTKKGYARGFFCLTPRQGNPQGKELDKSLQIKEESNRESSQGEGSRVVSDDELFQLVMQVGNRSDVKSRQDNDKEGFYKRRAYMLKKDFSFSVYLQTKEEQSWLPKDLDTYDTVAYMGSKRSAFRFCFRKIGEEEARLEEKVKKAFADGEGTWSYALSDLYVEEMPELKEFAIVEKKSVRYMETIQYANIGGDANDGFGYIKKRRKSSQQIHLIRAGSVFHGDYREKFENKRVKKAGYNVVVCLGGK